MSSRYRRAAAAYVRGHDRVWEIERKRGEASDEEAVEVEWSGAPFRASFGVGVASSLRFDRGPAMGRAGGDGREPDG